jgi:hypothetical protein
VAWIPVISSNLAAVAYNPLTRILSIRFHRSGVYHYHGVPYLVYQGLMSAGSKGKYFHAHIKDRYPFSRG